MINAFFGIALAIALEVSSLWLLGGIEPPLAHVLYYFFAHFIASMILALTVPPMLPANYRGINFATCLFIFLITFSLPLFGMFGLVFGLVPALRHQWQLQHLPEWLQAQPIELGREDAAPQREDILISAGHLLDILQQAKDQGKRLQALISTLSLADQYAVPLLRIALKDKDDDVRLLAYALMTRKEKALEESIRQSTSGLADGNQERGFAHHKALAQNILELAHLGTPGGITNILCDRARMHAEAGLQLRHGDAGLHFLRGRILLRSRDFSSARIAFRRAKECGIDIRKITPFLAEIAFHEKRFSEVGSYLKTEHFANGRFPLNHLSAYWNEGQHGSATR